MAALDLLTCIDHAFDRLVGDVLAHAVVDATPGKDDLRVVAEHLGLVGQIVGIDADAVPAHQAGPERQEVPLRARRLEHLERVDTDAMKDQRQFVDECDVEVALRVLDDLGRFGDLDALRPVDARP